MTREPSANADPSEAPAKKKKGLGTTALRFFSALPLIPAALYLMFGAPDWAIRVAALVWIAQVSRELMKMTIPESLLCRTWGVLATVGLSAVIIFGGIIESQGAAGSWMVLTLLSLLVGALVVGLKSADPIDTAGGRIGWMLAGPIYIGVTLSTVVLVHAHDDGGAWLLLAMFSAFLSDTGAYFAGRAFGKHKLYPLVSPNKTIEGSVGGLITAGLGAVAVQQLLLPHVPIWHAALLGVVAAAFGQAGDLLESLIKRTCGVKDSGSIMPGHGGLLDRSDALMFTSATVWVYVTFIG